MWKQPQLLISLWLTGVVFAVQPVWANQNSLKNLPLSEEGSTSRTTKDLLSQAPNPQSPILIDRVRVDTTDSRQF